jgi:hypothetical protein
MFVMGQSVIARCDASLESAQASIVYHVQIWQAMRILNRSQNTIYRGIPNPIYSSFLIYILVRASRVLHVTNTAPETLRNTQATGVTK